jgi:hypothetical protein
VRETRSCLKQTNQPEINMSKKSMIYLCMFVLAFILPSFSYPQEKKVEEQGHVYFDFYKDKVTKTTTDSITVSIRFQNPQLILTDNRKDLVLRLTDQTASNKELLEVAKQFVTNHNKQVELQYISEYESIMNYLQRKTQYSIGQINRFIQVKSKIDFTYGLTFLVFMLIEILVFVKYFKRARDMTLVPMVLVLIGCFATCVIFKLFVPLLYGMDYIRFTQLLNLLSL